MRAMRGAVTGLILAGMVMGSTATVSAQERSAPQPPVEVNGRFTCGQPVGADGWGDEEMVELADGNMVLTRYRGGTWHNSATVDDPRLEGDWYNTYESDTYASADDETGPSVAAATWRVENDKGAWEGGQIELTLADGTSAQTLALLTGERGYAGLTAILETELDADGCHIDVRGVIVEGMPALEPYDPDRPR